MRIATQLATLQGQREPELEPTPGIDQFERVLALLSDLDWDAIWDAATYQERRTLLDEFVGHVNVFADHLEVEIRGAPKLNVALHEVGLQRAVETAGVGGAQHRISYWILATVEECVNKLRSLCARC